MYRNFYTQCVFIGINAGNIHLSPQISYESTAIDTKAIKVGKIKLDDVQADFR